MIVPKIFEFRNIELLYYQRLSSGRLGNIVCCKRDNYAFKNTNSKLAMNVCCGGRFGFHM